MLPPIFGQILMITFSIILCIFTLMLMGTFSAGVYYVIRALKKRTISPFNPYAKEIWEQVEDWRKKIDIKSGKEGEGCCGG